MGSTSTLCNIRTFTTILGGEIDAVGGSRFASHKFIKVWVWGVSFDRLDNSGLGVRRPLY